MARGTDCLRNSDRLIDFTASHRLIGGRAFDFVGHEYLKDIYLDESPAMVIRKAAQMGASEYAISRALHFAVVRGGCTVYFFPSESDVTEFSQDRFGPAIAASDYLSGLVRDTDTVGLKQIGAGSIYLRGTRSRTRMKSVPADFLIFDELDEMQPANIELARKRLGHSELGWELALSTPSLPGCGIDAAFAETDQRYFLLHCEGCGQWSCLEDIFLEHHGSPDDPREEICFIQGPPGAEELVCIDCGRKLDPGQGTWVAKRAGVPTRGYQLSKFVSQVVSERERQAGHLTKPAALLAEWRHTDFPAEFYASELGMPYLAADGGLSEDDLLGVVGPYGQTRKGRGCVMGVDQGRGLHVVVKEPHESGLVFTVQAHHEPHTDATFTHLDHFMETFDVRTCVIDAQPNTHAARDFARRYPGRVHLAYYGNTQKGLVDWGYDKERMRTVNIHRTEAFDAWRDAFQKRQRRIPRVEGEVTEYVRQLTNILRTISEDPVSGTKQARWINRGPDHYAHADCYAEIALRSLIVNKVTALVLG